MSKNLSQAPVSVCAYTFVDGRHCRMPIAPNHLYLCAFHAQEAQTRAAEMVGHEVSDCFSGGYVSACEVNFALARVFAATARGEFKPQTAAILGYLGQNISHTIHLAQHEYINAFGTDHWRHTVRLSFDGLESKEKYDPKPVKTNTSVGDRVAAKERRLLCPKCGPKSEPTIFRMNTSKSLSKQTTLTTCRMNTCEKKG